MAITPDNLKSLDYGFDGSPFVNVPAKTGMNLGSMDYAYAGQPFVPNPDAATSGNVKQINIADSWKTITGMQINISDSWKAVASLKINIGDSWKVVF